jgi:hypothetical protein
MVGTDSPNQPGGRSRSGRSGSLVRALASRVMLELVTDDRLTRRGTPGKSAH